MVLLGWTVVIPWWLLTSDCLLSFPKERMLLKQAVNPLPICPSLSSICASLRWDISSRSDIKCCGYFSLFFFLFLSSRVLSLPPCVLHFFLWPRQPFCFQTWLTKGEDGAHLSPRVQLDPRRTEVARKGWTLKRNSSGCNKAKNFPFSKRCMCVSNKEAVGH